MTGSPFLGPEYNEMREVPFLGLEYGKFPLVCQAESSRPA